MPFEDLVRAMQIARGANEYLLAINVGLLFFSETPENFFPYSWIEVNIYHDNVGDSFTEKIFKGAVYLQLKEALSYIKGSVIQEHVKKVENQAEAIRFYNYPYSAIEEDLANAVYHKSYELRKPIEVNLRLDRIEILSYAGVNCRVGDFFRELHLTEGKGTGIPQIRRAMKNNDSNDPIFETDDDRSYFLTTLFRRFY